MSNEIGAVDWAAALAEIEAEIAKLQATADVIRERMARTGIAPVPGGGRKRLTAAVRPSREGVMPEETRRQ